MVNRKPMKPQPLPADWVVSTEIKLNGRNVDPGTELTFNGARGRFLFIQHVKSDTSEWIDARASDGRFRSFHPDKIKRVHAKSRLRQNVVE